MQQARAQEIKSPPPLLRTWKLEQLRLTAFATLPLHQDARDWWQRLANSEPDETRTTKARTLVHGAFPANDLQTLRLTLADRRIDWLLTPGRKSNDVAEALVSLGAPTQPITEFHGLMRQWLTDAPPLERLAFGCVLLLPVQDQPTAVRELLRFWPGFEGRNIDELTLQVNQPRPSTIPGVTVNRVSKWESAQWGNIVLQLAGLVPQDLSMQVGGFVCRVELDINSSPQSSLKDVQPSALWDEFLNLSTEFLENGPTA